MKFKTKLRVAIRDLKLFFKRKKENKFDYIFSLGYNCEIGYRLYDFFKFEESNIFNWSGTDSTDHLIWVMENFDKIGSGDFEGPNPLWKCVESNMRFHGKVDMNKYVHKIADEETIKKDKEDLISRVAYLKSKFLKMAQSLSKKLYVYKIRNNEIDETLPEKINKLYQSMQNLGAQNFKILVLYEKKNQEFFDKEKNNFDENIILRSVDFFAPDDRVTDRAFQNNGYDKIWEEFYCTQKGKKRIKKYKFE